MNPILQLELVTQSQAGMAVGSVLLQMAIAMNASVDKYCLGFCTHDMRNVRLLQRVREYVKRHYGD